jgi:hypothetical protein
MEWVYDNMQKEIDILMLIWTGLFCSKASAFAYNQLS